MKHYPDANIVKSRKGFTLLELVVSLFIIGLMVSVAGMSITAGITAYQTARENVRIAQRAQLALSRINRELMELTDVAKLEDRDGDSRWDTLFFDSATGTRKAIRLEDTAIRIYPQLAPGQQNVIGETGYTLIETVNAFSMRFFNGPSPWDLQAMDELQSLSVIEVHLEMNRSDNLSGTAEFVFLIHPRNIESKGGANV